MKRLAARISAATIVLALALPALASAPADQYATYNSHDLVIADRQTGLHWQRGFATSTSWDDAYNYCQTLALAGIGSGTWRLPSIKELLTLVDEAVEREYVNGAGVQTYAIDRGAFPTTPSGSFWAWPKTAAGAWTVDFSSGQSTRVTATVPSNYVRCVY